MYGPDCCYHHGPSFYAAITAVSCSLPPAQPFCLSLALQYMQRSKAYVLSYSRALNRELKSRKIFCDGCLSGTGAHGIFRYCTRQQVKFPLYKKLVMADPGKVVAKAIRDSIAGREVSVYGIWMKVFWVLAKVFPHSLILDIMEKIEYAPGKERW